MPKPWSFGGITASDALLMSLTTRKQHQNTSNATQLTASFLSQVAPIKMNIGGAAKAGAVVPKPTVASVFNTDDDEDEPEEMPAEARMRMRNIGR